MSFLDATNVQKFCILRYEDRHIPFVFLHSSANAKTSVFAINHTSEHHDLPTGVFVPKPKYNLTSKARAGKNINTNRKQIKCARMIRLDQNRRTEAASCNSQNGGSWNLIPSRNPCMDFETFACTNNKRAPSIGPWTNAIPSFSGPRS
ncbi:MAG: hypothetical protein CL912_12900 [Deltaproteobacteria bacterium]|nr:hypothetical protein [Deltaproteobacteria bacterium]